MEIQRLVKTNLASHADAYHARLTLSPSNMISPENGMYVSTMEDLRTLVDDTGTWVLSLPPYYLPRFADGGALLGLRSPRAVTSPLDCT